MPMTLPFRIGIVGAASVLISAAWAMGQVTAVPSSPPAYTTSPEAAGQVPASVPPAQAPIGTLVQRSGGSLLRAESGGQSEGAPLTTRAASFYDVPEPKPKLLRKHDLVTIVIRENSQFISNGTTDLKHGNDLDAVIDNYVTLGLQAGGPTLINHLPVTPIEMKTSGQRDFKGDAQLNRADSYTGRITAQVIDVKPNGTLVLQADEHIKTDEEEQNVTLVGVCRVEDVAADNTVLSNQLFDLSLNKQHKGAVKDTTERGFFTRLLDSINPF